MTEYVKNDWRVSDALTAITHNDKGKKKVEAGRDFKEKRDIAAAAAG